MALFCIEFIFLHLNNTKDVNFFTYYTLSEINTTSKLTLVNVMQYRLCKNMKSIIYLNTVRQTNYKILLQMVISVNTIKM